MTATNNVVHVVFAKEDDMKRGRAIGEAAVRFMHLTAEIDKEYALQNEGVSEADIADLGRAMSDGPNPASSGFGPKVSAWMGRMISKAADGSWAIGTGAAGNLLSTALSKYYGFS